MTTEPMFPIMKGPAIPWSLIAPYEAQAKANHYQTLKRLAERGGLSICEAMAVMSETPYDKRPIAKPSVEDWLDFVAERKARAERRSDWRPTHRHLKSGALYQTLNVVTNATNAQNGEKMVLYRNEAGQWFVRERSEWEDGRFERLDGHPMGARGAA